MELHKLGFKLFAERCEVDLLELIPVFHGWIQRNALEDLLIDVADYSHVHAGPGIVLVAHEGNYGFDLAAPAPGLLYHTKRPGAGDLAQRLEDTCRRTLAACRLLEQDSATRDRLSFRGHELQIVANDRLAAPNTEATYAAFEPALTGLLDRLYPGAERQILREPDPRERFGVTVRVDGAAGVTTLLERLAA